MKRLTANMTSWTENPGDLKPQEIILQGYEVLGDNLANRTFVFLQEDKKIFLRIKYENAKWLIRESYDDVVITISFSKNRKGKMELSFMGKLTSFVLKAIELSYHEKEIIIQYEVYDNKELLSRTKILVQTGGEYADN